MKNLSLEKKGILIIFLNIFCVITITAQNAFEGYTLYNNNGSHTTYLIDMEGSIAHSWQSNYSVANTVYLLENGSILRTAHDPNAQFNGGAVGGIIQEINWEGDVVWQYNYSNYYHCQHHDVKQLPNGNIILIAWERKSSSEAVQAGRSSNGEIWPLHIIEVQPTGSTSGEIVWEWHIWDHLVQDHDQTKDNYGVIADHPELLNINCNGDDIDPPGGDWIHSNGIDYNAELDQIVFSSHMLDEFYIIDHSTTTAEAASHSGGNAGMGGDILYRWGNPQNYDRGNYSDRKFYVIHNSHWIDEGLEGEGNIMVFNNGQGRPGGSYSSVDVVEPPIINTYNYSIETGMAFGPEELSWTYATPVYSNHLSGAQRLPNGNTLVIMGTSGYFVEINEDEDIVWSYASGGQCTRAYRYSPYYPGLSQLLPIVQQQIDISSGFNFLSTRLEFEEPDMLVVLQDILDENLVYVRGSEGEMLRKIGPNWVNGIGDWMTIEGYLFKMTGPETLVLDGLEINPSTPISLSSGFQFVSYLPSYSEDALIAFNNILNDNLKYIRNSVGGMLRKIGSNWVNGLGDANPGEGFLIKMSDDDELIYPQSDSKKHVSKTINSNSHFIIKEGNAAEPVYTIYISGLNIGDEVSVYDGELLAGAGIIVSDYILENSVPVFGNLFEVGNKPTIKVWNKSENEEYVLNNFSFSNPYGDAYIENAFPLKDGEYSMLHISTENLSDNNYHISIFPNPSEGIFNVSIVGVSGDLRVEIIDLQRNNSYLSKFIGLKDFTTKQIDLKEFPPGIYFASFSGNQFSEVKKIVKL